MYVSNKIINKFSSEKTIQAVNYILRLALLVTVICVFVPFSPSMPAPNLDASWIFGMNQAIVQGLSFGKEIIFTYGPYSSILTKSYHPATDFMMLSGSLYLAMCYWTYLLVLMKDAKWRWILIYCAALAGFIFSIDALLFSLPLVLGLVTFKIQSVKDGWLVKNKLTPLYIAILFAPLGLLPLVKGSLLILCGTVSVLCSLFFIANSYRIKAIICLLSPIVSILFFWTFSEQSLTNLPDYLISMAPLVSGYTDAMATHGPGPLRENILYLISSGFLLQLIFIQKQISNASKIFLFFVYFVFLFLSFKAGFVRHDVHATIASSSILIAALLLPFIFNARNIIPVVFIALISSIWINNHYMKR